MHNHCARNDFKKRFCENYSILRDHYNLTQIIRNFLNLHVFVISVYDIFHQAFTF